MKTILIALFTFCSGACFGEDMRTYLADTKKMVADGEYEEALKRHIWFQDHALENDPAMSGVRLSFALSDWKKLCNVYPPAMVAMKEMRDNKTQKVLDNNTSSQLFGDVVALNRTLGEEVKSVELFEKISAKNPELAKACWPWAKDPLFNVKRYDLIQHHIGNPVNEFMVLKAQYDLTHALHNNSGQQNPELRKSEDRSFVNKSLELMQYAMAVKDPTSAKEVKEKALAVVDDNRLKDFKVE